MRLESDDLLNAEEVAGYLGVGPVTVYRWCREGNLPCLKMGRAWRIRRSALEEFLERSERPSTLVGRLRSFLEVPDNLLSISQDERLLHRLDAAFFKIAEARGGAMIKYHRDGSGERGEEELRRDLEADGFEVLRAEAAGNFRFVAEDGPPGERPEALREAVSEVSEAGKTLWANFNWEERLDLEAALEQQRELSSMIEENRLVLQTGVLEGELDDWPGATQREAQAVHSGTIWLSEAGLSLSRVHPQVD